MFWQNEIIVLPFLFNDIEIKLAAKNKNKNKIKWYPHDLVSLLVYLLDETRLM